MVATSAGQLVVKMVACWVDWSAAPTAAMRVETKVVQMAANSVCWWVDSMVE